MQKAVSGGKSAEMTNCHKIRVQLPEAGGENHDTIKKYPFREEKNENRKRKTLTEG